MPRQFEKFLLHFVYELTYHNVSIPWDEACHRFHPGFSGNAMRQKLDRLRKELIAEGHLVPPDHTNPLDENGEEFRGFVRANESPCDRDFTSVRVVKWEEPCLDRQRNLPDSKNFVHNRSAQAKVGAANVPKLVLETDDTNEEKVEEMETDSDDEVLVPRRPRRSARTVKRKYYKDTDSDDEAKGNVAQKSTTPGSIDTTVCTAVPTIKCSYLTFNRVVYVNGVPGPLSRLSWQLLDIWTPRRTPICYSVDVSRRV